jgi:S-adenosylmethionine:tRNA ribosyltransferase-isomerase
VAAPTAGLHFTPALLDTIKSKGVQICFVTLHVGAGTFAPVKTEVLSEHHMHEERYSVPVETELIVNQALTEQRRVLSVGTTSLRVLESVARANNGRLVSGSGRTNIFIYPPYDFKVCRGLLTNFHLPKSTLLMLVSAFAAPGSTTGVAKILTAYNEAIKLQYRFFSYGDAMLIL